MGNLANAFNDDSRTGTGALAAKQQMIDEYKAETSPAPTPAPSQPVRSGPSPMVDRTNPKAQYGDRGKEKRIDVKDMVKPLGSYKKGGKLKRTGIFKGHKGERVLNVKQTAKVEKSGLLKGLTK